MLYIFDVGVILCHVAYLQEPFADSAADVASQCSEKAGPEGDLGSGRRDPCPLPVPLFAVDISLQDQHKQAEHDGVGGCTGNGSIQHLQVGCWVVTECRRPYVVALPAAPEVVFVKPARPGQGETVKLTAITLIKALVFNTLVLINFPI